MRQQKTVDWGPPPSALLRGAEGACPAPPDSARARWGGKHALYVHTRGPTAAQGTYSSFRCSPCGKQVFRISVMLFELRSSTSKER